MAATVTADDLGELTLLGSGGQGAVYAVAGRPVAYKEFAAPLRDSVDVAALLALVRLREELPAATTRLLDERAAWPTAVVERDGVVTGFLMPRAPEAFHTPITLPSGRSRLLAQVQLLLNDERYLAARGLAVDDRFRLELLHDVAATLDGFHRLGIVAGDLSPVNLLFTRERRPRCFFLDCDAMRLRGASVLGQAETADWQAPAGDEQVATPATDSYKFALLCVRLFAGHQSSRDPAAVERAGPVLRRLVQRGLSPDPRVRPTMGQWEAALAAAQRPRRPAFPASRRWGGAAAAVLAVLLLLAFVLPLRGCSGLPDGIGLSLGGDRTGAAEQAAGVARLLADSRRSRDRLEDAVTAVKACAGIRPAAADLGTVAAERRAQAERVKGLRVDQLPGAARLPERIVAALVPARQAADAYASWAAGVVRQGCPSAALGDPDRGRGDAAARRAQAEWKRVAQLWNPLADAYGHPRVAAQRL
ncbi:hypothetical protein [Actinoplanes sp. URMC 104]|uniref:hypothetical protein n=1 Tax=Actinoplanes sp. URMC 104 TaxID=3423409 RepID=UPI003F1CACEC